MPHPKHKPEERVRSGENIVCNQLLLYWKWMNTVFVNWQVFKPNSIRLIKVCQAELTLVYANDAEICLEFEDPDQMDVFVENILSNVGTETPQHLMWN